MTSANYEKAVDLLKQHFDSRDLWKLRKLHDITEQDVCGLESLGVPVTSYRALLVSVAQSRLPTDILVEIGKGMKLEHCEDWELETLMKLLRWSETKNLKISNPDNIFFLYQIMIKLCTLKHLENINQKLKLKFS